VTNALAELNPFVEALALDASGAILLDGRRIGSAAGSERDRLAEALIVCVYEHLYTQAYPPTPRDVPDEQAAAKAGSRALIESLAAANATRQRSETGWTLAESWADGSVVATRGGRTRRFGPGQFLPMNGAYPAPPGTPLAVQLPAGSATHQPGFYYCFGEGFRDVHDQAPIVRLYWNVTEAGAASFVAGVTGALNRYEIPFELKVTTDSAQFARRDNAVLYLSQDLFHAAWLALVPVLPRLGDALRPGIPLFTRELARGVGLAEDPGGGDSFGSARSRLVAGALAEARAGEAFSWTDFETRFVAAVRAAELDIDALWLNPRSKDIYVSPQHSLPRAAA
jgi:hypothetical protein